LLATGRADRIAWEMIDHAAANRLGRNARTESRQSAGSNRPHQQIPHDAILAFAAFLRSELVGSLLVFLMSLLVRLVLHRPSETKTGDGEVRPREARTGPVAPASGTGNETRGAEVSGGEPRAMLPVVSAALPQVAGGYPGLALPLYGVQSAATGRRRSTRPRAPVVRCAVSSHRSPEDTPASRSRCTVCSHQPQVAGGYPGPRSRCRACVRMMTCRSGRALILAPCDHQLIQSPS